MAPLVMCKRSFFVHLRSGPASVPRYFRSNGTKHRGESLRGNEPKHETNGETLGQLLVSRIIGN